MSNGLRDRLYPMLVHDGMLSERIIYAIYREIVTEGNVCFDVGASLGLHTEPLARLVGTTGHVYAFEAIPFYAAKIRARLSDRFAAQLSVIESAVFDRVTELDFHWIKERPGYSGINIRPDAGLQKALQQTIRVRSVTIDDFVRTRNIRVLRFIKMDIEGAEFSAMRGAEKAIDQLRPMIIFEGGGEQVADLYHYTMEEFFDFFGRVQYRLLDLLGQPFNRVTYRSHKFAWNFIAVPCEGELSAFDRDKLPGILGRFEENPKIFSEEIRY